MSTLFAVLVLVGLNEGNASLPSVQDLEAGIRKNREIIRFGTLQIKNEGFAFDSTGKTLTEQALRDVWFNAKQMRVTWIGKTKFFQDRDRLLHACVPFASTVDSLYFDDGQIKEIGTRVIISQQEKNSAYNTLLFDPKALGLYPMPIRAFSNYKLEGLLSVSNFKGKVRGVDFAGNKSYEILYDGLEDKYKESKTRIRMIVIPDMGYSVPEIELTAIYNGKPYQQLLQVDVRQMGKSKIWYPAKLHFKRNSDGKLVEEDVAEIVKADFDTPPPDRFFQLAALNIPAGTPVDMKNDGRLREWDGKQIVEKPRNAKHYSKQFPDLPPVTPSGWSSPWLWAASGLMLAGSVFFYWAWRRKPAR